MRPLFIVLACLIGVATHARETLVRSQAEYHEALKTLRAGDTIVLAKGEWRDFEVLFKGNGTAERPITLTAETKGQVILTGQSNLRLAGEYLVVSGLVFKNGYSPTDTVIAFRSGDEYANHSRVTEVVIDRFNKPDRTEFDIWVAMDGKHNRFDHNHLEGKSNQGVTLAVRLDGPQSQENHHRIDHNYFGPRQTLGSNGGETIRIGTSHYSLTNSFTVVENNYFDRCDGEVEIVSSKSGGNVFRGNVFFESRGALTLRHGNDNVVEGNVFFGNHVEHTGGIRVINKRQTVRNNYLYGLTGHRFAGALVVMNGVPNSPINRYHQVEDSVIEHNSIIESAHIELAAGADEERSAPPIRTRFSSNLLYNEDGRNIIAVHDDVSGIRFAGNIVHRAAELPIKAGFTTRDIELTKAENGLLYPVGVKAGASRKLQVLDKNATGVPWYPKADRKERFDTGAKISATDAGSLAKAVVRAQPGDIIELAAGKYVVERTLIVDRPLTIRSADAGQRARLEFTRNALFEIADGGSLKLVGVDISGKAAPDMAGNSVIRTSRYSMLSNYTLEVEDVVVGDLDVNHSFNFFAAAKSTFADRIRISRSTFSNITGHVLVLNNETDDLGLYSAEYITIADSKFADIEGTIADVYRGGTDESTFGPHFELSRSTLRSVGSGKRNKTQASVRLLGVQQIDIRNNTFSDSRPVRVTHTVGEPSSRIVDNRFVNTPEPEVDTL
ncbi:MAG TPA: polysaccharide lyase 6 family protein [Steroidobacteraceae bacterium]